MVELKPLLCENCGGQIDRSTMKCPYCDTQYERTCNDTPIKFAVERPGVHVLRAQVKIPNEAFCYPEEASNYAINKLTGCIADGLKEYMKIYATLDEMSFSQIIRGEVRVIDPTFTDY
jgi:hypothetical protein